MAAEPERPIEKLLRQFAGKRREEAGAPFELDPAKRRELLAEFRRVSESKKPEPRSLKAMLRGWWPRRMSAGDQGSFHFLGRLAWGIVALGMLAGIVALVLPALRPGGHESDLAKNEAAPAADTGLEGPPPAPAPVAAPPAVADKQLARAYDDSAKAQAETGAPAGAGNRAQDAKDALGTYSFSGKEKSATFDAPPAGAVNPASESAVATSGGVKTEPAPPSSAVAPTQTVALTNTIIAGKGVPGLAGAPSAATRSELALADSLEMLQKSAAATSPQRFARVEPGKLRPDEAGQSLKNSTAGAPAQAVLLSFDLENIGHDLRIVDRDGSVYTGSFASAPASSTRRADKLPSAAPPASVRAPQRTLRPGLAEPQPVPIPSFPFRVTGTNRSLNQLVVFTGSLSTGTNALPPSVNSFGASGGGGGGGGNGARAAAPTQSPPAARAVARITGTLSVGSNAPVAIEAEREK